MRMIFVNLPVADLDRAKAFHQALGHTIEPKFTDDTAACVVISDSIFVMLLTHARFRDFIVGEMADAKAATGALLALSADSVDEVKAIKAKALAAGATDWKPDQVYGDAMYGVSFRDPDGHVWEVMWMSPEAADAGGAAIEAGTV